mgnify:CR=1 FL=1|tara:strand:- start:8774 stop:9085 length:312 start_codon:yes stop_codon:yes gene_type:complete
MIYISNDNKLTVQSTAKVSCSDKIIMIFPGGEKEELIVNIEADFSKLKPEHHEIFLQSFSGRYNHHTQIFNTHTNYDGSKVPTIVGKSIERKSIFDKIKKWFK